MALEAASAENLSSGLDADLSGFLGAVFVIWMATPDLFACERASTRARSCSPPPLALMRKSLTWLAAFFSLRMAPSSVTHASSASLVMPGRESKI